MKILAMASIGGHWIQLLRLTPAIKDFEVVYAATNEKCSTMVKGHQFYKITDFNRWNPIKMFYAIIDGFRIIIKENPDFIITTGSAPCMIVLFIGKLFGCKTIWIESIANVEKQSLSGKIASKFASRTYVQWENLSTGGIKYEGSVLK